MRVCVCVCVCEQVDAVAMAIPSAKQRATAVHQLLDQTYIVPPPPPPPQDLQAS